MAAFLFPVADKCRFRGRSAGWGRGGSIDEPKHKHTTSILPKNMALPWQP